VFASVMTGNLVLLGLSASTRDGRLALHAGLSLCGYVTGALVGTRICRSATAVNWPRESSIVLGIELSVLVAVAVARLAVAGTVPGTLEALLLAAMSGAMGLQSAVGRAAPLLKRSTTYLTGALTEVIASVASGDGLRGEGQTLLVLGAAVLGAGAEAALVLFVPRIGPVLVAVAVATVLLVTSAHRLPSGATDGTAAPGTGGGD
jgi:uncharacterized membrane protein YoaK (UPF0700 family)